MNVNTRWVSDPEHSTLGFKIKHLMISSVSGKFNQFEVRSETLSATDFENAKIKLTAQIGSISTDNSKRDEHLVGADFFESEIFPTLEFNSTELEKVDKNNFLLRGDLSIKHVTNKVTLKMKQSEVVKDPWGGERIALRVNGEINRKDWELDYNAALETGGMMLGDTVKIDSEVQLVKQPVEESALNQN